MAKRESVEGEHEWRHWMPGETLEHLRAARKEWRDSIEGMLPPRFVEHRKAARREMLLAARSWIDAH
jgi:hypothetical protein